VAVQTIFKIPDDKKDYLPELIKVSPEDIPLLDAPAGCVVKLTVGKLGDVESPAKVKSLPRVVMLMVKAEGKATMELPLDEDLEHGFVYVVSGKCRIGNQNSWCEAGKELLIFGGGADLKIESGEEGLEALVVAGKPLNEPWVKLLGNNGFIIASTEEEAEKVMNVVQQTGKEFSFKKL
jgi:redox-sensitive bicupin YhaK (pirin superfamily)